MGLFEDITGGVSRVARSAFGGISRGQNPLNAFLAPVANEYFGKKKQPTSGVSVQRAVKKQDENARRRSFLGLMSPGSSAYGGQLASNNLLSPFLLPLGQ